jgi:hypothetical protein
MVVLREQFSDVGERQDFALGYARGKADANTQVAQHFLDAGSALTSSLCAKLDAADETIADLREQLTRVEGTREALRAASAAMCPEGCGRESPAVLENDGSTWHYYQGDYERCLAMPILELLDAIPAELLRDRA